MIENITDSGQFLYHYTKASTAVSYILKDRTLVLGSYTSTNDPKESKTWEFDLWTQGDHDLGRYNRQRLSEQLSSELKSRTRLACFTMDAEPLSGHHLIDIHNRGFSKPHMWHHYADQHKGICLVFDRKKVHKLMVEQFDRSRVQFLVGGAVRYVNRAVARNLSDEQYEIKIGILESLGLKAYAALHLKEFIGPLFFEKMTDWSNEFEYRWIAFSRTDAELYMRIEDSLVGIMFGERTEGAIVDKIMRQTGSWGVRYMGLKWRNCSPWYDFANMKYLPR